LPIITSFLALGKDYYAPVSGNWCWLTPDPPYLRYVLTHGWRFLFIIIEIIIYIHIYTSVKKRFSELRSLSMPDSTAASVSRNRSTNAYLLPQYSQVEKPVPTGGEISESRSDSFDAERKLSKASQGGEPQGKIHFTQNQLSSSEHSAKQEDGVHVSRANDQIDKTERKIKKMLLMNGYPIAYIILWLPGIANRIAEATGHEITTLAILQASTQLIGLANAINYGLTESMVGQLKMRFKYGKGAAPEDPEDRRGA